MGEEALQQLFDRATELGAEERRDFLKQACGDDAALLTEVQALLAADEHAAQETFWEHSAVRHHVRSEQGSASQVGEIIGQYRLVELIGKGGMGTVYRAQRIDAAFEKFVAIKLINGIFQSSEVIQHFRAERQILANLEHPNIARLLDGGTRGDGLPYLIMEYVEGRSPYDFCRERGLSLQQRLLLFRQICAAVHFAHQNMVIHRDLKPANILVTEDGTPKLLDFGIAKVLNADPLRSSNDMTEPGTLKLTARYASPEQVRGELVTTASDVYSLGVILYELLSGHSPYGDRDRAPHELMAAVCEEEPGNPSRWVPRLRGDLDKIIQRALSKSPRERYPSVDQFSEDIQRHLDGLPVVARGQAPLYLIAKFVRRYRVFVIAATLVLCTLVVGLVEVTLARARAAQRFSEVRQLAHAVMFDYADAIDRLPGSTPVRNRLVKDALQYLDSLSAEADTPDLQREIVDGYVRVSNVEGNEYENNLGDPVAALSSAAKAARAAEALLKADSHTPALASAADAFATYGDLLFSTGDLAATGSAYSRAISLRQKIAAQPSVRVEDTIALSSMYRRMADLDGGFGWPNLGKTAEALTLDRQSMNLVAPLMKLAPDSQNVVSEGYQALISLSTAEFMVGNSEDAASHLAAAITQIEKVRATNPGDATVMIELAIAELRYSQFSIVGERALPHIERAASLLNQLLTADPHNAVYRRRTAVLEAEWGRALRNEGERQAAVLHVRRALSIAEALAHDAPASAQYRTDVGVIERELADGLVEDGAASEALHYAEQAERILCMDAQTAREPYTLANCAKTLVSKSSALGATAGVSAAVASLRKAESIATSLSQSDPANAIFRTNLLSIQARLRASLHAPSSGDSGRPPTQLRASR